MLARDHGLGVVQGETGGAELGDGLAGEGGEQAETFERARIGGARRVQQRLGEFLQLFEIGPLRER